jgi:hypothetical protein
VAEWRGNNSDNSADKQHERAWERERLLERCGGSRRWWVPFIGAREASGRGGNGWS